MVDRIIASLNGRPPGLRFDMEFVIGAEVSGAGELPTGQTLQMARAGSLAREMLARGAPPDTISIGLQGGAPNKITMWFFTRATDEVDLFYKTLAGTLSKPAAEDGSNNPSPAAPSPGGGPSGQ